MPQVYFEWDIETEDEYGDIIDHHHSDDCPGLPDISDYEGAHKVSLVLVRDVWDYRNNSHSLIDRTWAYVENGKLPNHFSYEPEGRPTTKVPQKFHTELAHALAV